jgi:hypothetical protein
VFDAVQVRGVSVAVGLLAALWSMHPDGSGRQAVAVFPGTIAERTATRVALFTPGGLVVSGLHGDGAVTIAGATAFGYASFSTRPRTGAAST